MQVQSGQRLCANSHMDYDLYALASPLADRKYFLRQNPYRMHSSLNWAQRKHTWKGRHQLTRVPIRKEMQELSLSSLGKF